MSYCLFLLLFARNLVIFCKYCCDPVSACLYVIMYSGVVLFVNTVVSLCRSHCLFILLCIVS